MSRIKAITLFWILTEFTLILSISFRPKNFKLEKFENCPGSENLTARFRDPKITMPEQNLYLLSGFIDVDHNITIQTAMSMNVKRCNMDRTHCEDYDHMTISKLCNKLRDAKAIWAPMVKVIQPPPACPVILGPYSMTNATANLSVVSRLPLDGYLWAVRFTIHQDGNPKKVFMCVDVDVTITNQKRRSN